MQSLTKTKLPRIIFSTYNSENSPYRAKLVEQSGLISGAGYRAINFSHSCLKQGIHRTGGPTRSKKCQKTVDKSVKVDTHFDRYQKN